MASMAIKYKAKENKVPTSIHYLIIIEFIKPQYFRSSILECFTGGLLAVAIANSKTPGDTQQKYISRFSKPLLLFNLAGKKSSSW
jgi:hypothetical protein